MDRRAADGLAGRVGRGELPRRRRSWSTRAPGRGFRSVLGAVVALVLAMFGATVATPAFAAPTPGASPTVHVWATSVNARHGGSACIGYPSTANCPTVGAVLNPGSFRALCQKAGATNTDAGYSSKYWTWIALNSGSGFVSNVYITGAAHLAGVPDCASGDPASVHVWATSVNVRAGGGSTCINDPSTTHCPTVVTHLNPATVTALCQQSGATNTDAGYSSAWWTWVVLPAGSGYVSNVYISGAAHLAGVPDCYKAPTVHVPGAPTNVHAVAGDASAKVTWTAPANGGAAITKYTVTASPGGRTATSTTTSATVTGLLNNTAYTFTVKATNSAGTGPSSAASNKVTPVGPVTKPGAPTAVHATAGDASAKVTWTAPSSTGGAAISKYTVTSSPGGKTATSTTTSATVGGLTNGTAYTFTVTATNSAGTGAASAPSNAVTPSSGPPPVTSKPQTTNSHYIRNRHGTSGDLDTARSEGAYDAGKASPDPSLVLLSYGNQSSSPAGAGETGGTGAQLTDDQIATGAEAYIDGWRATETSSTLTVVISPNNDSGWLNDDPAAAGQDWANNVIDPVIAHVKAKGYTKVVVDGGMDVENWGPEGNPTQTKQWVTSFLASTTADFVNHGAASGCPTGGGDPAGNGGCPTSASNDWSQKDYYDLSGGLSPSRMHVLPQIYNTDMPSQWQLIDLYGVANGHAKLDFFGPLTENRADCEQNNPPSCTADSTLTPTEAWNDLWNKLRSDSRTSVSSLPYSTDLFDDSYTTTPPVI